MTSWKKVLGQLRAIEHLLKPVLWRDRLKATCFQGTAYDDEGFLKTWSSSLASLRWLGPDGMGLLVVKLREGSDDGDGDSVKVEALVSCSPLAESFGHPGTA